jgi:hypothetical protein
MRRLLPLLLLALVSFCGAGCQDSREKDKNKDLDRPKTAERG